ncbi:(3R)-hydroxymyristoyl-[acyl-carrier-protein] dehydratase [Leminorella richardii]|uniref:(3R)-hydroxymyristoyl-[acyl-carrier-protein] dehydratase n=1 Tax=Leminorella richardii TaxID=158841 RepID=A0A2X4VCD0_9GAMM|nr:hydroxymyristoyl-ACP dehydratase [Leminorella richardii]SQI44452.1 (3R)-hydroxymyristoyl-[acyl-carrier-protein] dehydratase [Leminorella richardii]
MMLPEETGRSLEHSSATFCLTLSPELFWFKGHFPQQALLPGVTQIHWAVHYATEAFALNRRFSGIDVVKFQRPLFPGESVVLTLSWDEEKGRLSFQYRCQDAIASSGRIDLCL